MDKNFVEKVKGYGLTVQYSEDYKTFAIYDGNNFHYSNRNDNMGKDLALAWCEIYKINNEK